MDSRGLRSNAFISVLLLTILIGFVSISMGKAVRGAPSREVTVEGTQGDGADKITEDKGMVECSENVCVFQPKATYEGKSIEGTAKFIYDPIGRIIGEAGVAYRNADCYSYLGFQIIINYEMNKVSTVKLNLIYSKNGVNHTIGGDIQRFIPGICVMRFPPFPILKLCIKLTQATVYQEKKIELCFTLRIQLLILKMLNLYTRCMKFTTSSRIGEVKDSSKSTNMIPMTTPEPNNSFESFLKIDIEEVDIPID